MCIGSKPSAPPPPAPVAPAAPIAPMQSPEDYARKTTTGSNKAAALGRKKLRIDVGSGSSDAMSAGTGLNIPT